MSPTALTDAPPAMAAALAREGTPPPTAPRIAMPPRATSDDDVVIARPMSPLAKLFASRRNIAIAGGAFVLLVIIIAVAAGGGDDKKAQVVASNPATQRNGEPPEPAKPDPSTTPSDEPAEAVERDPASARVGTTGTPSTTTEPAVEPTDAGTEPGTESATEPTTEATEAPVAAKPRTTPRTTTKTAPKGKTIGGKQVVLEYDAQIKAAPKSVDAAPKADQNNISKARVSYAAGNQRLLAGDWDGAVRNYKQSLAYYPGYVAGYRGLGLAYSQAGDKAKALQAFRMYIGSVPTAKDAPLIRKRIATLQSQSR